MWLTTVTYDLVAIRALGANAAQMIQRISAKKDELKVIDGHGTSIPEFPAPDTPDAVDPTATTLVVKREWNTEAAAQEFANFVNAESDHITATFEELI